LAGFRDYNKFVKNIVFAQVSQIFQPEKRLYLLLIKGSVSSIAK
jgi:hypothetical protein